MLFSTFFLFLNEVKIKIRFSIPGGEHHHGFHQSFHGAGLILRLRHVHYLLGYTSTRDYLNKIIISIQFLLFFRKGLHHQSAKI